MIAMQRISETMTGGAIYQHDSGEKIRTDYIYPPIPDRRFDWQAYRDDDEPNDNGSMVCGHGRSEQEAIDDLLDQLGGE